MINKTLFVYNSLNLFKILHEIKENLYFEIKHIDQKDYKKVNDIITSFKSEKMSISIVEKFSKMPKILTFCVDAA